MSAGATVYRVEIGNGVMTAMLTMPDYRSTDEGDEFENTLILAVRMAYRIGKYTRGQYLGHPDAILRVTRSSTILPVSTD